MAVGQKPPAPNPSFEGLENAVETHEMVEAALHMLGGFCLHTLYGAHSNAQLSCDGAYALTLGELLADTLLDPGRDPRSAKALSLGPCSPEAGMDAFYNHRPFKLGKYSEHLKQRLAGRSGCIDALLVKVQIHTLRP